MQIIKTPWQDRFVDLVKNAEEKIYLSSPFIKENIANLTNGGLIHNLEYGVLINESKQIEKDFLSYYNDENKPTLKEITDIKSHLEDYHVNQINDILMGSILNNLKPTTKEYKNNVRNHLIKCLNVKSLLPESWNRYSKSFVEEYYPKYNVWYWKPSNGDVKQKAPI